MSVDDSAVGDGPPPAPDETATDLSEEESGVSSADTPGERTAVELPLDQVFEIVKNERRRLAIQFLKEREGQVKLGELAEHVAARENDTTVDAISSKERKRVYVGLYQCHLPKMDDLDIVDFNQDRGLVELGPNASRLDTYIGDDGADDVPWSTIYLGLAALGGVLLVVSLAGAASFGLTPALVSGLLVLSLGGCAGAQMYRDRTEN